jgi:hypothetical protein
MPRRFVPSSPVMRQNTKDGRGGAAARPGFEVDTLTTEQYEQRTTELGDQLRRP